MLKAEKQKLDLLIVGSNTNWLCRNLHFSFTFQEPARWLTGSQTHSFHSKPQLKGAISKISLLGSSFCTVCRLKQSVSWATPPPTFGNSECVTSHYGQGEMTPPHLHTFSLPIIIIIIMTFAYCSLQCYYRRNGSNIEKMMIDRILM